MEVKQIRSEEKWTLSTYIWMSIIIWFCANIISQAAFMGKFGQPYGRELLNQELGPIYWGLIILELSIYLIGFYTLGSKLKLKKSPISY
jgi:hypothetical protein